MEEPQRESLCALALNRVPGVGSVTYRRLIERFGSASGVFRAGRSAVQSVKGIRKEAIEAISATADPQAAGREEWEKVTGAGFDLIFLGGPNYPVNLAEIYDPPPVLYIAGTLEEGDLASVAVVGPRAPSDYGFKMTAKIVSDLASAGVVIVSGMARGIDSAAHRAALEAGGRTIAVLGSGMDVIYPPENKKLFNRIREQGAVISPFPMGTRPDRGNFPARNRIISGLSKGVLVVQAPSDSGALITANHAIDQGRDVFAVPGAAGSPVSKGTNRLIKKGVAKLVENARDIIEDILPQVTVPDMKKSEKETAVLTLPNLNESERAVYEKTGDEPCHIDIIARECKIPVHELAGVLLSLELKGLIEQRPGKNYLRSA